MPRVGVVAMQGDFLEHRQTLERLGVEAVEVRQARDAEQLDALIIPGGESTVIGQLIREYRLEEPIRRMAREDKPIWGTCAGMIVLAKHRTGAGPEPLGLIDISVERNAFGRQVESFEIDLLIPVLGEVPFHAVFIRAPRIQSTGPGVQVLARLPDGTAVAAKSKSILTTAFHPELTQDPRFHANFISLIRSN